MGGPGTATLMLLGDQVTPPLLLPSKEGLPGPQNPILPGKERGQQGSELWCACWVTEQVHTMLCEKADQAGSTRLPSPVPASGPSRLVAAWAFLQTQTQIVCDVTDSPVNHRD